MTAFMIFFGCPMLCFGLGFWIGRDVGESLPRPVVIERVDTTLFVNDVVTRIDSYHVSIVFDTTLLFETTYTPATLQNDTVRSK